MVPIVMKERYSMFPIVQKRLPLFTFLFLFGLSSLLYLQNVCGQASRSTVEAKVSSNPIPAKQDSTTPKDEILQRVSVDTVSFLVTARGPEEDYISKLNANDFVILEDGEEQTIQSFAQDTVPVNTVFLVDASYSVDELLPKIKDAAVAFAEQLSPEDRFSAVIFAHKPIKVLGWTNDLSSMQKILKSVKTFGKTALYDSMEFTIDNMFEKVEGKKAIILLTDGVDNSSKSSLAAVMRLASERQITVYPILNVGSALNIQHYREIAKNDRERLKKVSKFFLSYLDNQNEFSDLVARNGGRMIYSEGYKDLKPIYANVVEELKNQYVLSYVPQLKQRAGKDVKELTVKLRQRPGKVSVRLGYFPESDEVLVRLGY